MHETSTTRRAPLTLSVLLGPLAAVAGAQATLYELPSSAPAERHGAAVRAIPDVDGDGVADLLIGAPGASAGLGRVQVVSGDTGMPIHILVGPQPGEFGGALAGADLDGDGSADPLVGAWLDGVAARGLVTVFDGATAAPRLVLAGDDPGDHFGFAVAVLGDVDADGAPDLAVGAVDDDDAGTSSGSVRVCSGADGSTLYTLVGSGPGDLLGYALCALDDLDGDGVGDLAIGAPGLAQVGSTSPGRVHVVSAASGATLFVAQGAGGGDAFGRSLARVGDLDGDGRDELAVGAPQPVGGQPGYARVLSSAGGAVLLELVGAGAGDLFGSTLAPAGDVDGDGVQDLAVGAPRADDLATDAGAVRLLSGRTGALLGELLGTDAGAHLGSALCGDFDPNGDGHLDLALGAPGAGGGRALVAATGQLPLTGDAHALSLSSGASVSFALDAGTLHAGQGYRLLGSFSGATPGTTVSGLHIGLNPDRYFALTLRDVTAGPLVGATGSLDGDGRAQATFTIPASAPAAALLGRTFRHAFVVLSPGGTALLASNTVPVTLLP
jgi:hypothetical protein